MKTYKTNGQTYTVDHASSLFAGSGHQRITVTIADESYNTKEFSAVTDNIPDFDRAMDLEGQEKYEALFELVEHKLQGQIEEWFNT